MGQGGSNCGRRDDRTPQPCGGTGLAHTIPSAVEAAYRRGDLFEKRKRLMNGWAAYLSKPPAEVIRPQFDDRVEVVA